MVRKRRCWVVLLASTVALLGLTGCVVRGAGLTGISLDGAGHWVVVLAWSCHRPDVVSVWHEDDSNTADPDIIDAQLAAPADNPAPASPAAGEAMTMTVDIFNPPADWTVEKAPQPLDPSLTYRVAGGTHDNSWSTAAVDFRLADLDGIGPGQVLYPDSDGRNLVTSMAEFEKAATRRC
jgi:hypothetical protein